MAEHEVMWIGRRPAAMAPAEHPATTEEFSEAVTSACTSCGCDVQDYVAAAGAYGSWLVRFERSGQRQRLVWNGKDGKLVLEQATAAVDWIELGSRPVGERDEAHFLSAIHTLLQAPNHAAQT
ncbi:MAG: hypothetical protein Q8N51_13380 [Gammaproteobacteria bacterium]|nr:hypothetical protein [Gammaproteobacteria bacterium]